MNIYKIFKKILCCTAIITLLTTNTGLALAADKSTVLSEPTERCTVTLTGPHGTKYIVKAVEVPQLATRGAGGSIFKTYKYSLENQNMQLAAQGGQHTRSQTVDEWDDSISVHGYLTVIYLSTTLSNGLKGYLLERVCGAWINSDSHVTMSGRRVAYTCQDNNNQQQVTLKYPTTSNYFNYTTGYSTYVSDIATGVLGANSHVNLNHAGSGTWSLDVTCNYFNNNILNLIMDPSH